VAVGSCSSRSSPDVSPTAASDRLDCWGAGPHLTLDPVAVTHEPDQEILVPESVYKVIELVGTSTESWEKAAAAAVKRASQTLRDLRVAEISQLDMQLKDGKVQSY